MFYESVVIGMSNETFLQYHIIFISFLWAAILEQQLKLETSFRITSTVKTVKFIGNTNTLDEQIDIIIFIKLQ